MAAPRKPTPALRRPLRVLGFVLCLLLAPTRGLEAGAASKGSRDKSFGPLVHAQDRARRPLLEELPKKWHRVLKRRLQALGEDSDKGRRTALTKLMETLAQQQQLAQGKRSSKRGQLGPREVSAYIEGQVVRELHKERAAWAVGALVQQTLDASVKPARRITALKLLVAAKHPDAATLLLLVANGEQGALRDQALVSMAHWPREELDLHLCQGFVDHHEHRGWQELLIHRVSSHGELNPSAGRSLFRTLQSMMLSEDWKVAGQALRIADGLPKAQHAEFLVTSIASVAEGVKSGTVRWRILSDLGRDLRELSGRSMGPDPRPWQAWYQRVLAGDTELDANDSPTPRTVTPEFFGLGRVSDHVTFVLDGSGSMDSPWGTGGRTYYEEAVGQLVGYLGKMGEGMYFRVVLFSDDAKEMIPLQRVGKGTLQEVESTMLKRKPDGATALGAGVKLALARNARDERRGKEGSSDTFIVLCDGATQEDESWARRLVAGVDFPLGLRFHCVQLGRSGARAMEALAEATGGRFVRVQP